MSRFALAGAEAEDAGGDTVFLADRDQAGPSMRCRGLPLANSLLAWPWLEVVIMMPRVAPSCCMVADEALVQAMSRTDLDLETGPDETLGRLA